MAKVTQEYIKVGTHVFVEGLHSDGYKLVPLEVVISGEVDEMRNNVQVEYANSADVVVIQGLSLWADNYFIYLGDRGVRPFNYDNRATQVFTTREDMQEAIDMWAGRNPNFLTEDSST